MVVDFHPTVIFVPFIFVWGLDLGVELLGTISRALLRTHVTTAGRNFTPYLYNENKKIISFIQSKTKKKKKKKNVYFDRMFLVRRPTIKAYNEAASMQVT